MKQTFKNENGHLIANVSFDADEIKLATGKAVNKLVLDVTVPGFRKGKAPKEQAQRYLNGQKVADETINYLLKALDKNFETVEEFQSYVKGKKLLGHFRPNVELNKFSDKEAEFTITWILVPTVSKLGAYTGLKSDVKLKKITAEDVEHELHHLAEDNAELVESNDKVAEKGDTANIDFVGLMNGEAFEGGSGKAFDLELGSGRFVPGFEDQVIGHKVGDKFDVALTMPENYPAPLTSKAVVFKVTLNAIKVKEVPEINDDFATTLTGQYVSKDLAELKKNIKDNLTKKAEESYKNAKINSYLLQVRNASEYVIPTEYVNELVKDRMAQDEDSVGNQGLTLDEYLKLTNVTKENYENNLKAGVENEIKNQLIFESLAEAEKIEAPTQKDIEAQIGSSLNDFIKNYTNYLKSMKMPEDQINSQIQGYINQVFASILSGKVQARILELNEPAKKEPAAKKETATKKETAAKKPAAKKAPAKKAAEEKKDTVKAD